MASPLAPLSLLQTGKPSISAQRVAMRRAAHQILDNPRVFEDPLAVTIVGSAEAETLKTVSRMDVESRYMRAFMAVRSRFAEDQLFAAVGRGCHQYVLLGAGLDTFAYRNPDQADHLHVFEVDHPATQQWKRQRLAETGIAIPTNITYVPVDFEERELGECLRSLSSFQDKEPAFFSWLGVTPYLTPKAFRSTLEFIASMPAGSGVVFDYAVSRSALNAMEQTALSILSERLAAVGEPFQLFFEPKDLASQILQMGFQTAEDLGSNDMNARYFKDRSDGLRVFGGFAHLLCAIV